MAHPMSSAQIERDFSAASLVLPSNRGSMDARYFQAQFFSLVNFLHLVHPENMSPKSMSVKEVYGHCCLLSFRGNLFVIYTPSNMLVLWSQLSIQKCFSKIGVVMRNPKKKIRKESWERTSGTTKWDKLGQVGVRGTSGTRRRGLQILVGQVGQGKDCLQIFVGQVGQGQGVCPLEPFHLSQMGLQGRGKVVADLF